MDIDKPSSSTGPLTYLEQQEASAPAELKERWTKIKSQYERKLWHNLTTSLMEFVFLPGTGEYQIDLYEKAVTDIRNGSLINRFISTLEGKINALRLAEIARRVGREYAEPDLTLTFLQSVHSRLPTPYAIEATDTAPAVPAPSRPIPEAYALSLSSIAYAQLLLGDLSACKKSLDACEKLLGEQDTVEPVVNAGYYGVAADYFKVKADYGPYYKNALLYLACVDSEQELQGEDRVNRARDLCLAALLGETIYNFGELLQHPILQTLNKTEHEWIKDLIGAFNAGEIGKFESLANNFGREPILESSLAFLRQKICLMALIQAAFARPRDGSSRLMSFQQVAEATRVPVHEVEHLIMKALSLKLIRGSVDQIDSTVDITWVQPRVLDAQQLEMLAGQFGEWTRAVGMTETRVGALRESAQKAVAVA